MDFSLIACAVCLIITVAIYVYFLKNNFKQALRKRIKLCWLLTAAMLIVEGFLLLSEQGRQWLASFAGLEALSENSALKVILGGDFIGMMAFFVIAYTLVAVLAISYLTFVLTKPPRLFY